MLNISNINVHRTRKLRFDDDLGGENSETKWLKISIECDDDGHGSDGFALFYSEKFTSEDVCKAMKSYLAKNGYMVLDQPPENAL